jgi:hypothetical protein
MGSRCESGMTFAPPALQKLSCPSGIFAAFLAEPCEIRTLTSLTPRATGRVIIHAAPSGGSRQVESKSCPLVP